MKKKTETWFCDLNCEFLENYISNTQATNKYSSNKNILKRVCVLMSSTLSMFWFSVNERSRFYLNISFKFWWLSALTIMIQGQWAYVKDIFFQFWLSWRLKLNFKIQTKVFVLCSKMCNERHINIVFSSSNQYAFRNVYIYFIS